MLAICWKGAALCNDYFVATAIASVYPRGENNSAGRILNIKNGMWGLKKEANILVLSHGCPRFYDIKELHSRLS
jgi:hypothetical protein